MLVLPFINPFQGQLTKRRGDCLVYINFIKPLQENLVTLHGKEGPHTSQVAMVRFNAFLLALQYELRTRRPLKAS